VRPLFLSLFGQPHPCFASPVRHQFAAVPGLCRLRPSHTLPQCGPKTDHDFRFATRRFQWRNCMKASGLVIDEFKLKSHWVTIEKVVEYTGYSDDAIRKKKWLGVWREGVHWRKAPDNRLVFNLVSIQNWMSGGLNA